MNESMSDPMNDPSSTLAGRCPVCNVSTGGECGHTPDSAPGPADLRGEPARAGGAEPPPVPPIDMGELQQALANGILAGLGVLLARNADLGDIGTLRAQAYLALLEEHEAVTVYAASGGSGREAWRLFEEAWKALQRLHSAAQEALERVPAYREARGAAQTAPAQPEGRAGGQDEPWPASAAADAEKGPNS